MIFLNLLRVHQWIKNAFMFAPLFFSGRILDSTKLIEVLSGFGLMCLLSSSVYILNDLLDLESDRQHPVKRNRALASGKIKRAHAVILMLMFASSALIAAFLVDPVFFYILSAYAGMNVLYSIGLKKVGLLDICIISFGFVLRVLAGGTLSDTEVSQWLYIMTFLLALFIALAKRRDDLVIYSETGTNLRQSIQGYNMEFVSGALMILSAVLMVSYLIYITSPEIHLRFEGKPVYISALFVAIGLLRYLQLTLVYKKSGSPTKALLTDFFLSSLVLGWIIFFMIIIYI